jgi:predicted DNA binding CopG/RHH family protein
MKDKTKEAQMLLNALVDGQLKRARNAQKEIRLAESAAKEYLKKNARINIRLSRPDVLRLKRKAAERGIPYQTLIASILHQFASGQVAIEPGKTSP